MPLIVCLAFFAAFTLNVVIGSITGEPLLSNVVEMLLLLASSIAFVVMILQSEARARDAATTNQDKPEEVSP